MVKITERGYRGTVLGQVLQLKIHSLTYALLSWREVWDAFSKAYPNKWAVQFFPPAVDLVDVKNVYHLWVLETRPLGFNLMEPNPRLVESPMDEQSEQLVFKRNTN